MTQFKDLELLYNQFFNLADEIKELVEKDDYEATLLKLKHKDKLIKKLLNAQKTVKLLKDEKQKLRSLEEKLKEKEQNNLAFFEKLRNDMYLELKGNKRKLKVNNAYAVQSSNKQGVLLDISE